MNYKTKSTIKQIHDTIIELDADGFRPTRQAIADKSGLSISYIHKLVREYPDYLGQPGDGTVSIVKVIELEAAPKVYKADRQEPRKYNDTPLSVLQSAEFLAYMARIVEALETRQPTVEQTGREITKKPPPAFGIPVELRKIIVDNMDKDNFNKYRESLRTPKGKQLAIADVYQLYLHLEWYLNNNRVELLEYLERVKDAIERDKAQLENQQSE